MWSGLLVMGALAGLIAAALLFAASRLPPSGHGPVDRVNALLPQIQCGQCGYPGCRPYAEAIIAGEAEINQCAPGGEPTVKALAHCLDRPVTPLDPAFGEHRHPSVAVIDEAVCIGCARCLDACPVDAILGAHRFMHTVIESECTGCELCVPVCPVDCIDLTPAAFDPWSFDDAMPGAKSMTISDG